jgi:hypothetical protein
VTPDDRYFEDYTPGDVYEFGTITVTEPEIIDFAKQFDPQYFHIHSEKAIESRFGGIIARHAAVRRPFPFARRQSGFNKDSLKVGISIIGRRPPASR